MVATAWPPQYRKIEHALRERLPSMHPGERLPSDAELCLEFGVSRMTARHAMQRLAEDGLVQRIPGRGTFAVTPPSHRYADRLMAFSHEMERQGRVPSSRLLGREVRPASDAEASALALRPGEPVVVVRRLRMADGVPIAIETAVLVRATASVVLASDLEAGSPHEALAGAGLHLRRGSATIAAEAATAGDARVLKIASGAPLLVERRVIADGQGRPIEATESRYPGLQDEAGRGPPGRATLRPPRPSRGRGDLHRVRPGHHGAVPAEPGPPDLLPGVLPAAQAGRALTPTNAFVG